MIELVGEENQGCPLLISNPFSKIGKFTNDAKEIAIFLANQFNV
ncbi:MAG: hypothetical protein ACK56F_28945, partial [bacterium]